MSGVLPPVKISELPPYTGADNPDGTLPITIAGTTYGINISKLRGSAPTPYRKVFTFSGGAQTFTLDSGVVAKSVFLNKAVLYNDSTSIQEWSQAGDIVTINDSLNTLEIDDQIYILN